MNDIYETVAAACQLDSAGMDSNRMCCSSSGDVPCHCSNDASLEDDAGVQRLAKFPVNKDNTDTSSEDSVKLTRSLTEKRKNYVRRVSSRASYLQASNADGTHVRYRHQTSVISAPIVTPDREPVLGKCTNPYATFRSWKSFKMLHSDRNIDDCGLDQMNPLDVADGSMFGQEDRLDNGAQESGEERLFEACILVGMNHSTGRAYIKSSYPRGVRLPPQIETLVFPETLSDSSTSPSSVRRKSRNGETKSDDRRTGRKMYNVDAKSIQCYSLVLTNERGERNFGYCRRVLPEGATFCLPLTYCLISKYRSTGFFYKILELIESHHGSPDVRMESALRQLHESKFPQPGESLHLRQPRSPKKSTCNYSAFKKNSAYRNSVNLGDVFQARALKVHGEGDANAKTSSESLLNGLSDDGRRRSDDNSSIFYDMENNNLSDDSQGADEPFEELSLKMSLEPRLDEDNLSILFDSLSVSMICKIFGTLLIERKVILVGENLSQLSSCIEALQTILYPFVWQHTLISTVPSEIRKDILEAPIPVLAGVLLATSKNAPPPQRKEVPVSKSKTMPNIALGAGDGVPHGDDFEEQIKNVKFEEGMLVELSSKNGNKPLFNQGDESSLLPSYSAKTLKASLSLDNTKDKAKGDSRERTRNFLIAEAFLRFFVDLIGDYWKFFTFDKKSEHSVWHGTEQEDTPADAQFEKDQFIKNASSKQNQYFLEWFTETAMFDHFKSNMATMSRNNRSDAPPADGLIDLPYPDFYRLFEERIAERRAAQDAKKTGKSEAQTKAHDNSKSANYKLLINKKVRLLKNKLRDLVNLE